MYIKYLIFTYYAFDTYTWGQRFYLSPVPLLAVLPIRVRTWQRKSICPQNYEVKKKTGPRFSTLRHPPKFTHLTLTLTWWRLWWWSPWDTGWLRPKQWWRGRERKLRQLFAWKSGKPILPGNYHHCYDDIGRTKEGDITIIPKTSWKDICSTIACKTIHSPLNKSM